MQMQDGNTGDQSSGSGGEDFVTIPQQYGDIRFRRANASAMPDVARAIACAIAVALSSPRRRSIVASGTKPASDSHAPCSHARRRDARPSRYLQGQARLAAIPSITPRNNPKSARVPVTTQILRVMARSARRCRSRAAQACRRSRPTHRRQAGRGALGGDVVGIEAFAGANRARGDQRRRAMATFSRSLGEGCLMPSPSALSTLRIATIIARISSGSRLAA